jgi:hypothetical protein
MSAVSNQVESKEIILNPAHTANQHYTALFGTRAEVGNFNIYDLDNLVSFIVLSMTYKYKIYSIDSTIVISIKRLSLHSNSFKINGLIPTASELKTFEIKSMAALLNNELLRNSVKQHIQQLVLQIFAKPQDYKEPAITKPPPEILSHIDSFLNVPESISLRQALVSSSAKLKPLSLSTANISYNKFVGMYLSLSEKELGNLFNRHPEFYYRMFTQHHNFPAKLTPKIIENVILGFMKNKPLYIECIQHFHLLIIDIIPRNLLTQKIHEPIHELENSQN